MNALWIVVVSGIAVLALLVVWLALGTGESRRKSEALEHQVGELRRDLQMMANSQSQGAGQIAAIGQNVTQRLENVTRTLQEGVAQAANTASLSQNAMVDQLGKSQQALGEIQKQLGAVQLAGSQMSQTAQTLEGILGGAKSRGSLGEVTLERLLEDCLPRDRFHRQYRFSTGETADVVVFLRDRLLPIDSKFPLDAFRRMAEEGEEARRAFAAAVKGHADAISRKYVLPDEGTLPIALMFVPSESVYYELLMTSDSKGQPLDEYCRSKSVVAVSPNTLYAHLQVILMGLQGMQIEENAKQLHNDLAGLEKQLENFSKTFGILGTHLRNAAQGYSEAEKRLEKTQDRLAGMLGGNPEAALPEPVQTSLALPLSESIKESS